ncbi:MAG: hypothetical protein N2114_01865, partial [Candidatus Goldbacteria bacterium]|nr:hypothetical protein [Candidatus Goldiibacteriota bacterium]
MKIKFKINKYDFYLLLINIIYLIILSFYIYKNFLNNFIYFERDYFLDVGSVNKINSKKISELLPEERLTKSINFKKLNYKELKSAIVYMNIKILFFTKNIILKLRFKDNFLENFPGFYIGAQNKEGWNYLYKPMFLPFFKIPENTQFIEENNKKLIFINKEKPIFKSIDEFFNNVPAGSVIATNINIKQKPIKIENYTPGNLDINVSLRGN